MRIPWLCLPIILLLAFTASCTSIQSDYTSEHYAQELSNLIHADKWYVKHYTILSSVERFAYDTATHEKYLITKEPENKTDSFHFEDELISIKWSVLHDSLVFELTNKTDSSLKIIWDEALFVGVDKKQSTIMHEGIQYSERYKHKIPTIVIRKGTLIGVILPNDYLNYFGSTRYREAYWSSKKLIPVSSYLFTREEAEQAAENIEGKHLEVLLPIEVKGTINEYIFVFEVKIESVYLE